MKLAKASKPRIELWYSQVCWGIITVQSGKITSGQQLQCYTGTQKILNVTGHMVIRICYLKHPTRRDIYTYSPEHTRISSKAAESRVWVSSEQFRAQRSAPGLFSSHGGHDRWKTRHQIPAGIQAPGCTGDQSSCPPVIGNPVHFGGWPVSRMTLKHNSARSHPGSCFPSCIRSLHCRATCHDAPLMQ